MKALVPPLALCAPLAALARQLAGDSAADRADAALAVTHLLLVHGLTWADLLRAVAPAPGGAAAGQDGKFWWERPAARVVARECLARPHLYAEAELDFLTGVVTAQRSPGARQRDRIRRLALRISTPWPGGVR